MRYLAFILGGYAMAQGTAIGLPKPVTRVLGLAVIGAIIDLDGYMGVRQAWEQRKAQAYREKCPFDEPAPPWNWWPLVKRVGLTVCGGEGLFAGADMLGTTPE